MFTHLQTTIFHVFFPIQNETREKGNYSVDDCVYMLVTVLLSQGKSILVVDVLNGNHIKTIMYLLNYVTFNNQGALRFLLRAHIISERECICQKCWLFRLSLKENSLLFQFFYFSYIYTSTSKKMKLGNICNKRYC